MKLDWKFLVVIGFLIIFFFPKNAGDTKGWGPFLGVYRTEYGCLGLKYSYQQKNCNDCGSSALCFGIVTGEKKCYGNTVSQRDVEMPCDLTMRNIIGCSNDSDCVAGDSCCHPQNCVNKDYSQTYVAENCKGVACTEVCTDCPVCSCVDNVCTKARTKNVSEGACC